MFKHHRELLALLETEGFRVVSFAHRGKHCQLVIEKGGKRARLFVANTPSDHRNRLNSLRDAKRAIACAPLWRHP